MSHLINKTFSKALINPFVYISHVPPFDETQALNGHVATSHIVAGHCALSDHDDVLPHLCLDNVG